MLSRDAKAFFYLLAGPLMRVNGWLYRTFRAPRGGFVQVQLGPGQKNYIPGWLNIDANAFTAKCDVWVDLRNRLPLVSGTVDAFYSHHVIEHLPDLDFHLREVFRCLKPLGVYRFGGPNGDSAIHKYVQGDLSWFGDFPVKRTSIGGRLENFIFCRGEHLTLLTESFLRELLQNAGFVDIGFCLSQQTRFPDLFAECMKYESESSIECPHTLIAEAVKPS